MLDFSDASSPFADVDVAYYLSLVEWTGRTMGADKPGSIPVELEGVLDRFGIDARQWAGNVRSYGSLFYRIAGKVEQLLGYAQRRGLAVVLWANRQCAFVCSAQAGLISGRQSLI